MAAMESSENRLAGEKSPYLLQHKNNPVDWYPWGKEAFEKARREDKPIFLSIGYSTCHWCHVMEHESFEDQDVARLMNDSFVSIKVDREERPDIDNIYMNVCQMMTGSGGWPLSILLTPEQKPFFAATYIPKQNRFGRSGMLELVPRIAHTWQSRRQDIEASADEIVSALAQGSAPAPGSDLGPEVLQQGFEHFRRYFDEFNGGFGNAPKFPTPHNFLFLLRNWKRTGNAQALRMVETTLAAMRRGGIYDHLGFGFHRYSTDPEWLLPHFEKMLYDQAMLTMAYTETFLATGKSEYRQTAEEILTYVLRDMTSPEGAFYSAEDADSEGVEGKFYLWTASEIEQVLGKEDAEFAMRVFRAEKDGNFVDPMHGSLTGENILHTAPLSHILADLKLQENEFRPRFESVRRRLFEHREKRIHPHKDDKVLTDWNGLMIAALSKAACAFDKPEYAQAAARAVQFVLNRMSRPGEPGALLHRYRDGQAAVIAHCEDYSFFIWGLIELYEATFEVLYLEKAAELMRYQCDHFWDAENSGFFFTSDQGEPLLIRPRDLYDGATPSGNSVSMYNLLRLSRLLANSDWEEKAAQLSRAFSQNVKQMPAAYTQLLVALDFAIGPASEVVIAGHPDTEDTRTMLRALRSTFAPNHVALLRPEGDAPPIARIAPFTAAQHSVQGKATAYVCRNFACEKPTNDPKIMLKLLEQK